MARNSRMNRAWSDDEDHMDQYNARARQSHRRNARRNTHRQLDQSVFTPVPRSDTDMDHLSASFDIDMGGVNR